MMAETGHALSPGQGPGRDAGRGQGCLLGHLRHRGPDGQARTRLVELIDHRITAMADRYSATYPSPMKCLLADRQGLTAYLRFPAGHHHRIRHSNFIERTFGETRRRTKVIGRLPGETSCLTLVWAVLDRASRGWRGLIMTGDGLGCCRTCAAPCSTRPASSGHAPSPPPRTRVCDTFVGVLGCGWLRA